MPVYLMPEQTKVIGYQFYFFYGFRADTFS